MKFDGGSTTNYGYPFFVSRETLYQYLKALAKNLHFMEVYQNIILLVQQVLYYRSMEKNTATTIFESLSSGLRLDVYRLLVRKGTEGMVAGEIASTLDVPPTNLSFHLKALTQAGMLTVEQEGRFQRYRANLLLMLDLIAYLTEECCSGRPQQCADMLAASKCSDAILPPLFSNQEALER